jgi:hypothetical protein
MSQNIIFKGSTNPVIIEFVGADLTTLSDISAKFGDDERTKSGNPTSVIVNSATELELNFQDTTETRNNYWCIKGDGFTLSSKCMSNLGKSIICEAC